MRHTRLVLYLAMAAVPAWASYQSVSVPAGASLRMNVPTTAPFTAFGDYRVAFRLHNWIAPASGNLQVVMFPNTTFFLFPGDLLCSGNYGGDQMGDYGNWECVSVAGLNDVVVRLQRFGNSYPSSGSGAGTGSTVFEVQDLGSGSMLTSYCRYNAVGSNAFPCVLDVAKSVSISGGAAMGGGATGYALAWLKWSSATVPPGSPMEQENSPADLADWRFEGSYSNQGTGGYAVTLGTQAGSPAFVASPSHPPVCGLQQQVFRAGQPAQLANYSYALDGRNQLTYSWQQISGPTTLGWSSQNVARPTINGGVFGSYRFQVTLTDGSGQTSTCSIKDGFVATDANGVVISANPAVDLLLGPQIQLGKNPWSWYDDRHVAEAAIQMANLQPGLYYNNQFWNAPGPGTITVANNSAAVTGSGTAFTTTFCQGAGNPGAPKSGAEIAVWYPLPAVQGGTGRRVMPVLSCQSDIKLTLADPGITTARAWSPTNDVPGGTGLHYSYSDGTLDSPWISNVNAPNFYDAVAALYALYYRSGIDDYRNAARTLADNFWQYRMDSGRNYFTDEGRSTFPRNRSILGMILRALDGRADMWSGLELVFSFDINQFHLGFRDWGPWKVNTLFNGSDPRETGYQIAEIAYCALFDSGNPTQQAACRTELAEVINSGMTPARNADGNWYTLYDQKDSWSSGTSVTLAHGSTAVTCNGNCNWNSAMFLFNLNDVNYPAAFWFTNSPSMAPTGNQDGDPVAYYPTFVDANHATLDRAYQGATGTHGWSTGNGQAGFGVQPYMLGILATAMDFLSKAMACTSPGVPTNCNATVSTTAKTYNVAMGNFLRTSAYWPARKAMYYFVGSPSCAAPISDTNPGCTDLNNPDQARTLNAEALRAVMTAYANSGDSNLLNFGDTLYTAMWGKPGFSLPSGQTSDGQYIWSFNDGLGWYMTGVPPNGQQHKYFGMAFGIGAGSAWPGYRLGGQHAGSMVPTSINFNLTSVPNAAKANLLVTYPTGSLATVPCAASPCRISFDQSLGNPLVQIQYLSAGGAVLATQAYATPIVLGN